MHVSDGPVGTGVCLCSVFILHTAGQEIVDGAYECVFEGDVVWIFGAVELYEVSVVGVEILHPLVWVFWPYDDDIV